MSLQKDGIIIDTEAFYRFVDKENKDSQPVHECIKNRKLQWVYGNDEKSLNEMDNYPKARELFIYLKSWGGAYQANSKEKKKEIDSNKRKIKGKQLRSNDTHIIAIALVEKKARLLFCTENGDQKLQNDFKNIDIIKPKGKIYKNKEKHAKSLLPH